MGEPQPDVDTGELVARAMAGDEAAIGRLYELYRPRMIGLVHRRLGRKLQGLMESADLVQSVWKDVLDELPGFEDRGEGSFLRWLHTCLLNKIHAKHRYHDAARRDVDRLIALPPDALGPTPPAGGRTPSQDVAQQEDVGLVLAALERLPAEQREVLVLRLRDGLSHAEVAARLGKSVEATRKLQQRSLARLQQLLPAAWRDALGDEPSPSPGA